MKGILPAIGIPAALTLLGAGVYFLLFPGTFSTDNQMYAMQIPTAEQAGMSIGVFLAEGTTGYLLGPTIAGGIAGIPLFLLAIVLFKQFGT